MTAGRNMDYCLAIDLGASSGRVIAGRAENGIITTEEIYRFKNEMTESDGHLIWDIENIVSRVRSGIAEARAKLGEPVSIAVDTWGVDYVLMKGDEPVFPCFAYRGGRTALSLRAVSELLPPETLYARTGIQFQPFNTIFQLYADKLSGRLDGATDFLMIPDYINYRLTGVKAHEYTNATTTGLINAVTRTWDYGIISALDLPLELFPEIRRPGEKLDGNIILCASHDTASAFESVDADENTIILSSGTWSLIGIKPRNPIISEKARLCNFTNEGGTDCIRFLKNIDGMYVINNVRNQYGLRYGETNAALEDAYNALARSYAQAAEELEEITDRTYNSVIIIGGGAHDERLNALTARYTGKTVDARPVEATAIGNLKIQMKACGMI